MREEVSRRRLLALAGGALSATVAGCFEAAPQSTPSETDNETESPTEPPEQVQTPGEFPEDLEDPPQTEETVESDSEYTQVFQAVEDSVVGVRIRTGGGSSVGTAWVYDEEYLVTNEHVVAAGNRPFLWFTDIGWREATVEGTDIFSDLAVLSVRNRPEEATPLPLVETPPPVGTEVVAVGNPFDLTGSFTTGVISGRNREIPDPERPFSIADGVQTDAALNPGNSGGPVLTLDGDVVGVVRGGVGDNVGFAISAAMTRRVIPALIEDGEYEHSFMGIGLQNVTPALVQANDLPVAWGAYVDQTLDGYPADGVLQGSTDTVSVAGQEVPVGGDVIVRMGDWTIQTSERLSAFLALETSPGDDIEVEVVRDGRREVLDVSLVAREQSF